MIFTSLPTKKQLHAKWHHEAMVLLQHLVMKKQNHTSVWVCVCVFVCFRDRKTDRDTVVFREWELEIDGWREREREIVFRVSKRERERDRESACLCVSKWGRERVCVCPSEWERDSIKTCRKILCVRRYKDNTDIFFCISMENTTIFSSPITLVKFCEA